MNLLSRWTCLTLLCLSWPFGAVAQDYPNRVVRLVVPFPPGGVVDISGRLLAEELARQLGANVIVENKVGAGGTIGAAEVARAPADGYTILLGGAATHAFAPWVYKQLRYDPVKDFVAVTQFTEGPLALCVNATSNTGTLADFVKTMKTGSAALNYASNGNGTFPHLSVELMNQALGAKPQHVPFPGGAQAVTALMGGQVQFTQNHIPVVQAHVKSGRLRVLATTGATRSPSFPDAPTLKESGVDVVARGDRAHPPGHRCGGEVAGPAREGVGTGRRDQGGRAGPVPGLSGRRAGEVAARDHQHRAEAGLRALIPCSAPTSSSS
jgi:tripartite-type tricarboxylate transporter receptor subunit TctC